MGWLQQRTQTAHIGFYHHKMSLDKLRSSPTSPTYEHSHHPSLVTSDIRGEGVPILLLPISQSKKQKIKWYRPFLLAGQFTKPTASDPPPPKHPSTRSNKNSPCSSSIAPPAMILITFRPIAVTPSVRLTAGLVAGPAPVRLARISEFAAGEWMEGENEAMIFC